MLCLRIARTRKSNSRNEATSKNLVVSASDGSDLDDNTEDEHAGGNQDTVLAGKGLSNETGHDSTKPSTKLENGRQPTLLCWIIDVTVSF